MWITIHCDKRNQSGSSWNAELIEPELVESESEVVMSCVPASGGNNRSGVSKASI